MTRSSQRSAALVAAALSLLLLSCKREPAAEQEIVRSGEREFVVPGTEHAVGADTADADGWQTEVWSSAITKQLKQLGQSIIAGENWRSEAEALEADAFEGARLRPEGRREIKVGEHLSLHEQQGEWIAGGSLADELDALLDEAGLDGQLERMATKVVGIEELGRDLVECEILVSFAGEADGSRRQLNGSWRSRWTVAVSPPALISVEGACDLTVSTMGRFEDVTHAALGAAGDFPEQFYRGQDYWTARIEMLTGLDVGGWQGLALADVNGDGWDDLYVAQPGGLPNRLFVANRDGTFSDRSVSAAVDFLDSSHANLFADLDNDGDQDLVLGVSDGVLVMENDGSGKFTPRRPKLLPAAIPYSIAAADVDADGDLDFYVCCYNRRPGVNRHHVFARPIPYHDANNGGRNTLFRNDGGWRFTDVTTPSGMDAGNRRFSYAAAWEDYDNDGDPDLYVANDFGRNNLYRNDTRPGELPTFTEVAEAAGVLDIGPGMSACWGDYNDDGHPDLYVSNMFSSAGHRVTGQGRFHAGADAETKGYFRRHARGNSLFANRGGGEFSDISREAGVTLGRWAWGSHFADFDDDGRLDLFVANGFISQQSADDL